MEPYSCCVATLRRKIPEPDEADAVTSPDRFRPAETGRAGRPAPREALVPARLHRFADRVGTRRQTREQIVARGVGHCGYSDGAAGLNAPALETGPRRRINEHLTIDRRGPAGWAGTDAAAARHRRRWRRQWRGGRGRERGLHRAAGRVDRSAGNRAGALIEDVRHAVAIRVERRRRILRYARALMGLRSSLGRAMLATLAVVAIGADLGHAGDEGRGHQGKQDYEGSHHVTPSLLG